MKATSTQVVPAELKHISGMMEVLNLNLLENKINALFCA
jgi:hypothetical protein